MRVGVARRRWWQVRFWNKPRLLSKHRDAVPQIKTEMHFKPTKNAYSSPKHALAKPSVTTWLKRLAVVVLGISAFAGLAGSVFYLFFT